MGISLKTAAYFHSNDLFEPWDFVLGEFKTQAASLIRGKLFRTEQLTSVYQRPTRTAQFRFVDRTIVDAPVLRLSTTGDVFIIGEKVRTKILQGRFEYDHLRAGHQVLPESGGAANYLSVGVLGTGDDLGPVVIGPQVACYIDTAFQSSKPISDVRDASLSRFLITCSLNVLPKAGDFFNWNARWFLIESSYLDNGFGISLAAEVDPGYKEFTYFLHQGTGGYNPTTGVITQSTVNRVFSALIGRETLSGNATQTSERKLEMFIYKRHLGFEPKVGDQVEYEGRRYYVTSVVIDREEIQWKVEVTS